VEEEMSSSSSSDDIIPKTTDKKKVKSVPAPEAPKRARVRIPANRRLEVIQNKTNGIEDPEYEATRRGTSWVVTRRKMPLDQTAKMQSPILPKKKPERPPPPPPPEPVKKKEENLHLSWANEQASITNSLKKDLTSLSEKYDELAQKYEKHKAKKQKKEDMKNIEATIVKKYHERPREAPPAPTPPPRPQTPAPQSMPPGKYKRARPLSIFDA
jgi:hypothetical protein